MKNERCIKKDIAKIKGDKKQDETSSPILIESFYECAKETATKLLAKKGDVQKNENENFSNRITNFLS